MSFGVLVRMKHWWRPSLARRVVVALLLAFALVWMVLLARDFQSVMDEAPHLAAVRGAAQVMAETLAGRDMASARLIVQASEQQYNALRQQRSQGHLPLQLEDLLFELQAPDGAVVYASAGLAGERPQVDAAAPAHTMFRHRAYWAAAQQTAHWRVTIMEPRLEGPSLLLWLAGQELPSLLIAFPFVFLPIWLAVRRGLLPLRHLAARVAARKPDDFSPLGMHLPYAELQPVLQAMDDLLKQSRLGMARERAMVQDAAHELRTPLAVLTTQAHALLGADQPEQQRQAKAALEAAVQRASHLVHQLLTLAQLEGADIEHRQTVDLVAVARHILIAASPLADQRGMEVALESPDRLDVSLDLMAFHSVLENLLRNALAYGRDHGQVVVTLCSAPPGRIELCVADDGPGIAAEDRAHLFERFHRGRHVQAAGAGLGLAIVQQAVDRLGGHITVLPGLQGAGVEFVVSLVAHE